MKLLQQLACFCLLVLPVSAQQYTTTTLGTLGGNSSVAFALNSHGQAAGESRALNGETHGFLWTKSGGMQDLGTLGGDYSSAQGINDAGQIVGISHLTGSNVLHPFRWTMTGGMQDLGAFLAGDSYASLINSSGQVAGGSCSPDRSICRAFFWSAGTGIVDLGTLGGVNSTAWGLNNLGQVVGTADLPNGSHHAFVWTSAMGMQDLGTLDTDPDSVAFAINNSGQVAGYSSGVTWRAFRWTTGGGMLSLGDLGGNFSWARWIDDNGRVAGSSALPGGTNITHTFLWTASSGIQDLGAPGNQPTSTRPVFMYKSGQIMSYVTLTKLFLWTPPSGKKAIAGLEFFGFNQAGQLAGDKNHIATLLTPVIQVSLKSAKNPSRAGVAVKFTATLKSILVGAPPDGEQVQFKDGSTLLGSGVLAGGVATFTTSSLPVGTHSITAMYAGDEIYGSSVSTVVSQVVNP